MNKLIKSSVLLIVLFCVTSCSSPKIEDYNNTTPNLVLEDFFNGELVAYGMVLDRNGKLSRRFTVKLEAYWENNKGTINEWFIFDDGEKSIRTWQLIKQENNTYTGTANDVVGTAKGQTNGSALYWQYDLIITVDGSEYQVTLDDWMYLLDDKRLFNKTDIIKYGLKVGEIILYIEQL
ncbi:MULTISPECIES: DUF3833 domain-containing protein [Colwelliaceae]|uniref:DUF3833 domain-containing protein n=1 Tax=Colwelliaceae TaxID=267889 RepID=UPI000970E605|nr:MULTISPECIES: DUF3833 domain-containing protein [Colwelliaceae]